MTQLGECPPFRLRLRQPVRHAHLAIHRRRGREVFAGQVALSGAPVERAEAAWASTRFPAWNHLLKHRKRIHQLVIGTDFYQRHPDVLDALANEPRVHFVLRPDGVFHPKLYLFENGPNGWACVCGSANFTRGASGENLEAALLIDGRNAPANLHQKIRTFIDDAWKWGARLTVEQRESQP